MKASRLFEKILDKWPVKLICFAIAVCLYMFHQISLVEKKTFNVPLKVVQEGSVMKTGNMANSVTVVVRAGRDEMNSIYVSDMTASVDIGEITVPGEYTVPVNLSLSGRLMAMDPIEVRVKPESVTVTVDRKAMKYVPVEVLTAGNPARGYRISSVSVSPDYVGVSGPEKIVDGLESVSVGKADVSGIRRNSEFKASYIEMNRLVSLDYDGDFTVSVRLEQETAVRTFDGIVPVLSGLGERFSVDGKVPPVSVSVSGPLLSLEGMKFAAGSVTADMTSVSAAGKVSVPVSAALPSGLELAGITPERIELTVRENVPAAVETPPPSEPDEPGTGAAE